MSNIAIIGVSTLFPKAKNIQEYWDNIIGKVDCITDIPPSHWSVKDYYDENPKAPDKTYCKKGGFIPQVDFNPMEFGLPPNHLEVTDVSQLLSLVVAKQALADAGYGEDKAFNREGTGVILGAALGKHLYGPLMTRLEYPVWKKVLKSSGLSDEDTQIIVDKIKLAYINWDENALPGMLANVISGRIAKYLNLGGLNCVVDAACASSLAAIQMAIDELTLHRCDLILTGGVDLENSIFAYLCFSKTPAMSRRQESRPFDIDADGMILGEGIGMVVLKRLEDAERDRDKIYAVIKGIGSSSDGRSKSIYAPDSEGQIIALRRSYEDAGFAPQTVGLIEAHGTGTLAGDPAEFSALKTVFGENNPRQEQIAIGSIKSQIGHTKSAAGIASLIKATLALHHKVLPPTINITKPNPRLNIENSPFYLNTETRPWIDAAGGKPRRAGVSSFGFGGTNYHVVLEEYQRENYQEYRLQKVPDSIVLFAVNAGELLERCQEVLSQLRSQNKELYYGELVNECKSLEIPTSAARIGFVAKSITDACQKLETSINTLKTSSQEWHHPQGIYYRPCGIELEGKVVALFSGQGSQYLEMGRELALNFPELRETYGYLDNLLIAAGLKPVSSVVFPPPEFPSVQNDNRYKTLQQTEYSQPAVGGFSVGIYQILQQAGFKPDFIAGHSFGELTGLWAAEVLSDEDYFFLVKARGQAMATPNRANFDPGKMMAVKGNIDQIKEIIQQFPTIAIANFNSPTQMVLAGSTSGIAEAQQTLQERGFSCILLPVAAAFHTPLVSYAQKPFAQAVDRVRFRSPKIPVYTNVTGDSYPRHPQAIQQNLKDHLLHPVRFQEEIETIYARGGYCFIEFGPRNILTNLVKDILGTRPHLAIALNGSRQEDSDRQLREAVVQLRVAGLPLKNFDPYQLQPKAPKPPNHKSLSVLLNGTNYVSEKTKNAFQEALQNGHQVTLTSSNSEVLTSTLSTVTETSRNITNTNQTQPPSMTPPINPENQSVTTSSDYRRVLQSLEYAIGQFNQHQSNTLLTHQQYLQCQAEYTKTFCQLTQQQNSLLLNGNSSSQTPPDILKNIQESMIQFHKHQTETLRIHEEYLNHQMDYARNFFHLTQEVYSRLASDRISSNALSSQSKLLDPPQPPLLRGENIEVQTQTRVNNSHLPLTLEPPQPPLLRGENIDLTIGENIGLIRSENIGLTREENIDLTRGENLVKVPLIKGDLGGSPDLKTLPSNPTDASLSTPSSESQPQPTFQTVNQENESTTTPASLNWKDNFAQPTSLIQDNLTVTTNSSDSIPVAIDFEELSQTVLEIVSEKTGYPTEVLTMDMDMEADLGIDSLKRVEIMGAIQDKYPDMVKPNLEELAELNLQTLSQVAKYMEGLISGEKKLQ